MSDINNFINTNFDIADINNASAEIIDLLKTGVEYFKTCNIFSKLSIFGQEITIFGIVGFDDFINTTTLIPNVFRVCYSLDKFILPNVCNQFVNQIGTTNYIPKILDEFTIKSLLYYNVPYNTKYYNFFQDNITRVKMLKSILIKKKLKSTNSSFSTASEIFNTIYTEKSMLVQLLSFYIYLYEANTYVIDNKSKNDFIIRWESTHSCVCSDLGCSKLIITGVLKGTFNFPNNSAALLNQFYIRIQGTKNDIIDNSIFRILEYALNVYNDVLLKINYYLKNTDYCDKDYMNINNIPKVNYIYNNFYNNELKTLTYVEDPLCFDYIPIYNNLTIYLYNFNNTYKITYPDRFFLKNIILEENIRAITVYTNVSNWNNTQTEIYYYYYYITIYSPTPYEIFNINSKFPTSSTTYTDVLTFVNAFNADYSSSSGIKNYTFINKYVNGGFYPKGGTVNNTQNIGYFYRFGTSIYIYETLESYSPYNPLTESDGEGVALLITRF
jgi:hypothetical protein